LLCAVCVDAVENQKMKSYIPQFKAWRCEQINIRRPLAQLFILHMVWHLRTVCGVLSANNAL
jgi:hypothetical protein